MYFTFHIQAIFIHEFVEPHDIILTIISLPQSFLLKVGLFILWACTLHLTLHPLTCSPAWMIRTVPSSGDEPTSHGQSSEHIGRICKILKFYLKRVWLYLNNPRSTALTVYKIKEWRFTLVHESDYNFCNFV